MGIEQSQTFLSPLAPCRDNGIQKLFYIFSWNSTMTPGDKVPSKICEMFLQFLPWKHQISQMFNKQTWKRCRITRAVSEIQRDWKQVGWVAALVVHMILQCIMGLRALVYLKVWELTLRKMTNCVVLYNKVTTNTKQGQQRCHS